MNDDTIQIDDQRLQTLIRIFKDKMPTARVGIVGSKDHRKEDGPSNAEIGAAHEFGVPGHLPPRSFLRMPISMNLGKEMESSGAFEKDSIKKVIAEKSIVSWMKKVASLGERCVALAFESEGFGFWPKLSPRTISIKKKKNLPLQILVATQQLRESIGSEVIEK